MMKKTAELKTDEELVLLAQSGDKQAAEELVHRHAKIVRSCVHGFYLAGGEAEDLSQEGMIGLFNAIMDYKKLEDGRSFKNFARLCVSRKVIDAVRLSTGKKYEPLNSGVSIENQKDYMASGLNPEDMIILNDDRQEFNEKMSRALSDYEFKIATMYMDGMRCSEISEITGKSPKSIDNAIQRIKKKLQPLLRETDT